MQRLAGVLAVTATYVFFLLYAQFGFLRLLHAHDTIPGLVDRAMGCMGLSGLVFSFVTAVALKRVTVPKLLLLGLLACSGSAVLSLFISSATGLCLASSMIGGSTAVLTVSLASQLSAWLGKRLFGVSVGFGTGLAYFICNIPGLFEASASVQVAVSSALCLAAGVMVLLQREGISRFLPATMSRASFTGWALAGVTLAFAALIGLDSAAFAVIQDSASLKHLTWESIDQKWMMGSAHFIAALIVGILLDRGYFFGILIGAYLLFATSFPILEAGAGTTSLASLLYAAGISAYSVCLVAYPSSYSDEEGLVSARWRSAALYGIAGWIGSGIGVGIAQHIHHIPMLALAVAGAGVAAGGLFFYTSTAFRSVSALALVPLVFQLSQDSSKAAVTGRLPDETPVSHGQRVYREEGCMNCHSQFIRPGTKDVEFWGPFREVDYTEAPPMIGNRRQGPDLMNVGNRRDAIWQRLHLMNPSSVSPGSKMPSYEHLFRGESRRGDDLVAYLLDRGASTREERLAFTRSWVPSFPLESGKSHAGQRAFKQSCSPCHGMEGAGDGPLSPLVNRPALNLRKGYFVHIPAGEDAGIGLARIVKFGVAGTTMPGHETLSDRDVAHIVSFLKSIHTAKEGAAPTS